MIEDLLIPFGLHRTTGQIVEPEDAQRGRDCNCVCPACKAPLLSRHPSDDRRIHFAHDTRHKDAVPHGNCAFNSALAVAMMVRELAPAITGNMLKTPELEINYSFPCCTKRASVVVTSAAEVAIESAMANVTIGNKKFDLALTIGVHRIFILLVYKGRSLNLADFKNVLHANDAVLVLNCDSFSSKALKSDRKVRFSDAVRQFLLSGGQRYWLYHPRTQRKLDSERKHHRCKSLEQHYVCGGCRFEWAYSPIDRRICPRCHSLNISPVTISPQ